MVLRMVTVLHGMSGTLIFTEMIRGPNPLSHTEQAQAAGCGRGPEVSPGRAE